MCVASTESIIVYSSQFDYDYYDELAGGLQWLESRRGKGAGNGKKGKRNGKSGKGGASARKEEGDDVMFPVGLGGRAVDEVDGKVIGKLKVSSNMLVCPAHNSQC